MEKSLRPRAFARISEKESEISRTLHFLLRSAKIGVSVQELHYSHSHARPQETLCARARPLLCGIFKLTPEKQRSSPWKLLMMGIDAPFNYRASGKLGAASDAGIPQRVLSPLLPAGEISGTAGSALNLGPRQIAALEQSGFAQIALFQTAAQGGEAIEILQALLRPLLAHSSGAMTMTQLLSDTLLTLRNYLLQLGQDSVRFQNRFDKNPAIFSVYELQAGTFQESSLRTLFSEPGNLQSLLQYSQGGWWTVENLAQLANLLFQGLTRTWDTVSAVPFPIPSRSADASAMDSLLRPFAYPYIPPSVHGSFDSIRSAELQLRPGAELRPVPYDDKRSSDSKRGATRKRTASPFARFAASVYSFIRLVRSSLLPES